MKSTKKGGRPRKISAEQKKFFVQLYLLSSQVPAHIELKRHGFFRDLADFATKELDGTCKLQYYDFSQDPEVRSFMNGLIATSESTIPHNYSDDYPAFPSADSMQAMSNDELINVFDSLRQHYYELIDKTAAQQKQLDLIKNSHCNTTLLLMELKEEKDKCNELAQNCTRLQERLKEAEKQCVRLKRLVKKQGEQEVFDHLNRENAEPPDPAAPLFSVTGDEGSDRVEADNLISLADARRRLIDD